jgi:hypothetical protein
MKTKKLTQNERISIIRYAHQISLSAVQSKSVEQFITELFGKDVEAEHGELDLQKEDLEDESQFLFSDSAEEIDEEDEDFGISPEMQKVQKQN